MHGYVSVIPAFPAVQWSSRRAASAPSGFLDSIASLTGGWSASRLAKTGYGGSFYTDAGAGAISAFLDQSGNTRNLTDGAAASRRPTLSTGGPNSRALLDFDGSSDTLSGAAISNFIAAGSGALVISLIADAYVLNNATVYQNDYIFGDQTQFMGIVGKNNSGGQVLGYNWDGNADVPTAASLATATTAVAHWRHHGGTLFFGINGTEASVASGNTSTMTGVLTMGGRGAQFANMKVFEAFATSDGSQSAAILAAVADMKTWIG